MQRLALVTMLASLGFLMAAVVLWLSIDLILPPVAYVEVDDPEPVVEDTMHIPTAEEILAVQARVAVCGDGLVAGYEACDCGGSYTGFFTEGGVRLSTCEVKGRTCLSTCQFP
jgi:hypothetical protein